MDSATTLEEIELLVRSKRTVIYVVSQEENRVLSALEQMCFKLFEHPLCHHEATLNGELIIGSELND